MKRNNNEGGRNYSLFDWCLTARQHRALGSTKERMQLNSKLGLFTFVRQKFRLPTQPYWHLLSATDASRSLDVELVLVRQVRLNARVVPEKKRKLFETSDDKQQHRLIGFGHQKFVVIARTSTTAASVRLIRSNIHS